MIIKLVIATDKNGLIGDKGGLPWDAPSDLRHFKRLTSGHTILMGRKTADSLKKPLKDRQCIVLTRNTDYRNLFFSICTDFKEIVKRYVDSDDVLFVCGGAEIYDLFIEHALYIYHTTITGDYTGDTYFDIRKFSKGFMPLGCKKLGNCGFLETYTRFCKKSFLKKQLI